MRTLGVVSPRKLVLASLLLLPSSAFVDAASATVDCRYPAPPGRIARVLAKLNPLGPNTIHVLGTCRENVVVRGFDRLVLVAHQGASLADASGGQGAVLDISDSRRIEIRGFRIVGGAIGVTCSDGSLCRFSDNTIEGMADYGVWIRSSQATLSGDTIQDVGNAALSFDTSTVDAWNLTVQGCGHGIFVSNGSALTGSGLVVSDNDGDGIGVDTQAHLSLSNSTISGNGSVGVNLSNQSEALLGGQSIIRGNGGFGVGIGDLSQVYFDGATVTGNEFDIRCHGRYSVATNIEGGAPGATHDCGE